MAEIAATRLDLTSRPPYAVFGQSKTSFLRLKAILTAASMRPTYLFFGLLAALSGCVKDSPTSSADKFHFAGKYPFKAVVTTGMVADLVRNVGGEHVVVDQLMGEGIDPHLYKTSTDDIDRLNKADLIFYSGLHLEGKMGDVFVSLARRKPVFAVTEGIPQDQVLEVQDGHYDPHLWFDVSLWSQCAEVVSKALCDFDPPHAA
jgi:manganese/zinc/iron transport system substrate-binding protein